MRVVIVFPHVGYCTGWRPHLSTDIKSGTTYHIAQAATYLYSISRHYTPDVWVVDFNFGSYEDNVRRVLDHRPDAVLISSTVNSYDSTREIAVDVARRSAAKIFIGGAAVNANYYLRPDLLKLDVEAEFLVTNRDIFAWAEPVFGRLDKLTFRDFPVDNSWLSETYSAEDRRNIRYTVITSLGCTYKCHFCLNPMVYKINYKDPELLRAEVDHLMSELDAHSVSVADPFFFMQRRHSEAIMDVMSDLGIPWSQQTCLVTLTDENLDRMAETGCHSALVGIENFHSKEINKPVEVSALEDRLVRARERGISVKPSFISGLLDIDHEVDVAQIRYVRSAIDRGLLSSHHIQSNIYTPYLPDPRDRLLNVPFRFWGVMPVTAQDEEHFKRNLELCDLIYELVFPETMARYQEVRAEYLAYLDGLDDVWMHHRPVPHLPEDKRIHLLTSGKVRV
jgi:radical SAM superfamily enzyme YgiQ (UPF0313 family)